MGGSKGTVSGSGLGLYLRVGRDPEPDGFWIGVVALVLLASLWADKAEKAAPEVSHPLDAGVEAEAPETSRP